MKFIAVALIVMMVWSTQAGQLLSRGSDLKRYLEGAKDGTFIVLFYDREAPQLRTEDMRNQIRTKILKKHPAFNYYEVDIQEQEYNPIVDDMMHIDRIEVSTCSAEGSDLQSNTVKIKNAKTSYSHAYWRQHKHCWSMWGCLLVAAICCFLR